MSRIIAVIGAGRGSGKTMTMEALIKELSSRGYRIGAVKQIHEKNFSIDKEGKDTWRMAEAGASVVAAAAPGEVTAIKRIQRQERFMEALELLKTESPDIILVEGNPPANVPKIFVARTLDKVRKILPIVEGDIICVASFSPENFREEEYDLKIPFYPLPAGIKKLASLIEKRAK